MCRRVFIPAILSLGLFFSPHNGFAQGTVVGTVTNEAGAPISFAQVLIGGTNIGAVADQEGNYVIRGVPSGPQTVTVSVLGFRTDSATISVTDGGEVTQNFSLAQDFLGMDVIVATAQRAPRVKLETSTAVTTLTPRDIEREAPRSTADLLKVVPGFYVEDSGGDVGGNLFARGMPADGSFRYVSLLEDGMPVFDSTELSFVNADIFVRVDANIQQIEAVRGGSAALFGSNAPGGLINFVTKTGGPENSGVLSVKGGEAGLVRIDGNVNGPLNEDWRYSVGGFFRSDQGIRDPGFTASEGGQIKGNVGRAFNNGYIRFYGKALFDSNIFYLPLPIQNPEDPDFVSGFPDDGTLTSEEGIGKVIPLPNGRDEVIQLDDGQKQKGGSFLVDLGLDFGDGWTVENAFRYMNISHYWNAMLPFELTDADVWAQSFVNETPNGAGFDLMFTETGTPFNTANNLLNLGGEWFINLDMNSVADQFQLKKEAGIHDFTVGTYLAHYEADPTWRFNDVVTNVQNAPRFVDLEITDAAGNVIRTVTNDGFRQYLTLYVNAEQSADIFAFFAGDEIAVTDNFDVDVGVRWERNDIDIRNEETDSFDVAGGTDAHTGLNFGTGTFDEFNRDFDEWAFSIGGNVRVNDQVSLYARGTAGFKMPILDNVRGAGATGDLEIEDIDQVEGGIKVGSPKVGLSAVLYWLRIQNFPSQDVRILPDGSTEFVSSFAGQATTVGSEIEVVAAPVPEVRFNGTLTLQNPEFDEFIEEDEDLTGNRIRRIPETLFNGGVEVDIDNLTINGDVSYVGDRFANNANTITLDSYALLDLGASYQFPLQGVTVSIDLRNVTDEGANALTEGNPRVDEDVGAQSTLFLARPVLPRRVTAGISYEF